MTFTVAAVVVLVPGHVRFLESLIDNLNAANPAFDNVLVIASGFSTRTQVSRIVARCSTPRVSIMFCPLGSAGRNRNRAWEILEEDIICFLDGDDLYAPHRNSVIQSVFESTGCDLFLHGFTEFHDSDPPPSFSRFAGSDSQVDLVLSHQLSTQPARNREAELQGKTPSTNLVFVDPERGFAVHHAHITVRATMGQKVRFHEVFGIRNEDGVFAQDVLESGGKVTLSSERLSLYRQGARAKPRPVGQSLLHRIIRPPTALGLVTVRGPEARTGHEPGSRVKK